MKITHTKRKRNIFITIIMTMKRSAAPAIITIMTKIMTMMRMNTKRGTTITTMTKKAVRGNFSRSSSPLFFLWRQFS